LWVTFKEKYLRLKFKVKFKYNFERNFKENVCGYRLRLLLKAKI